ncbi:MAG TPA: cobalt ECF transporter T component CbiQ [Isosphaeraceae bacterium]|jgi:cobalt/nickel transport system permease protein
MRPDLATLERLAESPGPLRRLDARIKILATVAFVVAVVATPPGLWWALAIEAVVLGVVVAVSRVPIRYLLTRWLGFLALVAFLAAMVAQAHPDRTRLGWWAVWGAILAKNSLAFVAVLTLAATTPMRHLLGGLGRLGVPAVLVSTLHFMMRYLHVLGDELSRMAQARRSRTFRRSGRLDWGLLTGLIGMLLVRSFERGERVHAAMLARGWDGTIRMLDGGDSHVPPPTLPSPLAADGRVAGREISIANEVGPSAWANS